MNNLFVTAKSIINLFKDHTKEDFMFFANEETGVYSHSWKTQGNWETTVKHGLYRVWTRQKVFHSELRGKLRLSLLSILPCQLARISHQREFLKTLIT